MIKPRYTLDELARLGDAAYDREVAPRASADDLGRFVAIDVESGAYEIDADEVVATDRLLQRRPGAQCWLRRVGTRYAHTFGLASNWTQRPGPNHVAELRP
jgi:hypothetical protein